MRKHMAHSSGDTMGMTLQRMHETQGVDASTQRGGRAGTRQDQQKDSMWWFEGVDKDGKAVWKYLGEVTYIELDINLDGIYG